MAEHPPVFIVGTGRCGSTLMSKLIHRHKDILSLSEVFTTFTTKAFVSRQLDGVAFWKMLNHASPVLRKSITPKTSPAEFTYPLGPCDRYGLDDLPACLMMTLPHLSEHPDALHAELRPVIEARPRAPLADQYRFWFDWLTVRHGKTMWIERTGSSLTMVKAITRVFPDAKFVHIHRDGRETALSMRAFQPMRVFLHMRNRLKTFGIDILRTPFRYSDSRVIYWLAPMIERFTPAERFLETEPSLSEVGQFWSDMVAVGMTDLAKIPAHRVHTVKYADLVSAPRQTLTAFLDFAAPGLSQDTWLDDVSSIPQGRPPAWKALTSKDQETLARAVAKGQSRLGYSG
ncbi:MAG: sulfotransferase [Pseudomonadota bacterium]